MFTLPVVDNFYFIHALGHAAIQRHKRPKSLQPFKNRSNSSTSPMPNKGNTYIDSLTKRIGLFFFVIRSRQSL